jgi:hypothetical protein
MTGGVSINQYIATMHDTCASTIKGTPLPKCNATGNLSVARIQEYIWIKERNLGVSTLKIPGASKAIVFVSGQHTDRCHVAKLNKVGCTH